jgi:hypothetical protein
MLNEWYSLVGRLGLVVDNFENNGYNYYNTRKVILNIFKIVHYMIMKQFATIVTTTAWLV